MVFVIGVIIEFSNEKFEAKRTTEVFDD